MSDWIPTWKDRLKACFQWRHRALHVFGIPAALGMMTTAVAADMLNASTGMGLGALVGGVGSLLAGYYVVSGFDTGAVKSLQEEREAEAQEDRQSMIANTVATAPPDLRPIIQRINWNYQAIEQNFADGIDDQVESVLQGSRDDLKALRDRAINLVGLYNKLGLIIQQVNIYALQAEIERTTAELNAGAQGAAKDALLAAQESTQKAIEKYQAAQAKQKQVRNVMTVIDTSLQEFKLAMELRKADATLSNTQDAPDVSELQLRLESAGQACDELVGGPRRRRRARA